MQADSIMFGALGALLQGTSRFEGVYRSFTRLPWLLPILLFLVSGPLMLKFGNYWNMPVGITINGALTLFWLLWLIRNPATRTGRIFNQPAVAWVGRLSYSLYIWQTLFLHHSNISILGHPAWWNTLPGSWLCILVVALFSYYVIEQPSLRVRDIFLRKLHWHET
jgi:peptidoglycan/LPS O-acetylase OafA/YrhL